MCVSAQKHMAHETLTDAPDEVRHDDVPDDDRASRRDVLAALPVRRTCEFNAMYGVVDTEDVNHVIQRGARIW
jgi:hypothetical protein